MSTSTGEALLIVTNVVKLVVTGTVRVRSGMQPDSLKLTSQLAILKLLHGTAFRLDETLGDKSSGKTFYLRGIQGQVFEGSCYDRFNLSVQVSRPVWNRDYFYLNGKIQEVRDYMKENCVQTVAGELLSLALDIFSRCAHLSLHQTPSNFSYLTDTTTDAGWVWRC